MSTPATYPLTSQTMQIVRDRFAQQNHHPSPEMWTALEAIAKNLEDQANNRASKKFHLSALTCGVGKSTVVAAFIRVLIASADHKDIGVLACFGRLNEVRSFVTALDISGLDLSVLTSDPKVNGLGIAPSTDAARVLITTHQKVERLLCPPNRVALGPARFDQQAELWFAGKRRHVVLWDESLLLAHPVTVDRDSIASLLRPLRRAGFHKHANAVEAIQVEAFNHAGTAPKAILFPDLAAIDPSVTLATLLAVFDTTARKVTGGGESKPDAFETQMNEMQTTTRNMWALSGLPVVLRCDRWSRVFVDYRPALSPDLAPALVLDASGQLRQTYAMMNDVLDNLERLPIATKLYSNLTVNLWTRAAGRAARQNDCGQFVTAICDVIDSKPMTEKFLVVYHKPRNWRECNIAAQLERKYGPDKPDGRVRWLNYGRHFATNDYAGYENVILAGLLYFTPSDYDALERASSMRRGLESRPDQVKQIERGEVLHNVFQSVLRGAARKCKGAECHPMSAYIVAHQGSRLESMLPSVFPSCVVKPWNPFPKKLIGKLAKAADYMRAWVSMPFRALDDELAAVEVAEALKITPRYFRKDIRIHPRFPEVLDRLGLEQITRACKTCFRVVKLLPPTVKQPASVLSTPPITFTPTTLTTPAPFSLSTLPEHHTFAQGHI